MNEPVRLQKYFTDCGLMSRRRAEEEIKNGAVLVNGRRASLGDKITPGVDTVTYRGEAVLPPDDEKIYIMLNKPRGVVTTASDEKGRATVTDLVSSLGVRVYPVGRLDMDSDGLLLLTNDGEFANFLTRPSHDIPKRYFVTFKETPTKDQLARLAAPMTLDGHKLRPVEIETAKDDALYINLYEGRNRQIRRMCEQVGLRVNTLTRVAVGNVKLGKLKRGTFRYLTKEEVNYLFPREAE